MRTLLTTLCAALLAGCGIIPPYQSSVEPRIMAEIDKTGERKKDAQPQAVEQALLPPLRMDMPSVRGQPIDTRFDLAVSNAPAGQVFMSIVSGTRYSMLLHPGVSGTITVNLKDVTIRETLDSIRELYGYDYKFDGTRIYVHPPGLQTRMFRIGHLSGQRRGASDLRVQSGSVSDTSTSGAAPLPATVASPIPGTLPGSTPQVTTRSLESSRVSTQTYSDFWTELRQALTAIIGAGEGRSVVVSSHSGVVVVRAFPGEIRSVEQFLRETRIAVERQVLLEAKIIEVTLATAFQTGINWAAFRNSGPNAVLGQLSNSSGSSTALAARGGVPSPLAGGGTTVDTAARTITAAGTALAANNPAAAIFGLALQTSNFAALLQFLESQGTIQVLSSPRIATLNNQKAVLKVGTDEYFVTNVSTVTTSTGNTTQQTPTVTTAPFFSGIVLDVTPQIDDGDVITLHVHPSLSEVSESQRVVNLGGTVPSITLPLAKSQVSETDTIVRINDGNIVAIGGLMSVDVRDSRGGVPGFTDALRNTARLSLKRELVILIKPTLIHGEREWEQGLRETRERFDSLYPPQPAPARPQ